MLFKNFKTVHVLSAEELKFIKSGTAPDCEEGVTLVMIDSGYICRDDVGDPIGGDGNSDMQDAGCIGI